MSTLQSDYDRFEEYEAKIVALVNKFGHANLMPEADLAELHGLIDEQGKFVKPLLDKPRR